MPPRGCSRFCSGRRKHRRRSRRSATTGFFIGLGLVAGLLAGIMAYLITYEEYRQHFVGARPAIRHALQAGLVAAGFFFLLMQAAGYLLQRMLL